MRPTTVNLGAFSAVDGPPILSASTIIVLNLNILKLTPNKPTLSALYIKLPLEVETINKETKQIKGNKINKPISETTMSISLLILRVI